MGLANALGTLLGLIFCASAVLKLLYLPGNDVQADMISKFERYAEVFPFQAIGITIEPNFYRSLVGVVELVAGSLVVCGTETWRSLSALMLLCIMIGAAQTNYAIGDLNVIGINVVFGGILILFLNRSGN